MTLGDVQRIGRVRGGGFKAWAMREGSFKTITAELGFSEPPPGVEATLWGVPVVIVGNWQPEGVIV